MSDVRRITSEEIRSMSADEVNVLWARVQEVRGAERVTPDPWAETVGAVQRCSPAPAGERLDWSADLDRLLVEDPRCLGELVLAGVRCGRSLRDAARFALEEADRLRVDPDVADEIVRGAVREARRMTGDRG